MSKPLPGATAAVRLLTAAQVDFELCRYDHDPAQTHFGAEAVARLGLDPERVFKTLLVQTEGGPQPFAVALVPVASQLDLKALAAAVAAKRAALAESAAAERITGYVVGGISPLGQKTRQSTVIDTSAAGFDSIHVSAGRRGLQVRLQPLDLIRLTDATLAPIARR
ncbi:MAG: Cys-tRNA(Pro) deacylase [Propionibacteriaceae bacterium]|nr:Cys-tRNA(Pro) deacylase [Propionibacteriaceae bacterium]